MSSWPKDVAGKDSEKGPEGGKKRSRILQSAGDTGQEADATAAKPEELDMKDVCPFLGFAHAIVSRKASAEELLHGAAPVISGLGSGFSPCVKDKCHLWHAERKECSVKSGMNALVEMNTRAAKLAGVTPFLEGATYPKTVV